jgi:hypothetical protein
MTEEETRVAAELAYEYGQTWLIPLVEMNRKRLERNKRRRKQRGKPAPSRKKGAR